MDLSVLLPFSATRVEQVYQYASLVEWTDVRRLWTAQSFVVDPLQGLAHLAGAGVRVPAGVGVSLMGLRHPYDAAAQAMSLARMTGQDLVVGFGPGSRKFQSLLGGKPYTRPLLASREYVEIVKAVVSGQAVDSCGEYFSCRVPPGARPAPRVEIGLGVLRPGMAQLAGEIADVAITWLGPAAYLESVIMPGLRRGAQPRRCLPRLVAIVPVALERSSRPATEVVLAGHGHHLAAAHYQDMLRQAGIPISRETDPVDAAAALIAGRAFLICPPEVLAEEISRYRDVGVDEVVLNMCGVYAKSGPTVAMAELKTILRALKLM